MILPRRPYVRLWQNFTKPNKPGFLGRLSEHDAFAAIIDSYRLCIEDEYTFRRDAGGFYAGDDPFPDFQRFLTKAEKCRDILPSWWSPEKRKACEKQALNLCGWSNLRSAVKNSDIKEHYGDHLMPMRFGMMAERATGSHVGGL